MPDSLHTQLDHPTSPVPAFFPVSVLKLVVMSICTLGLYELYWFHGNWVLIRDRESSTISPARRTLFAVLFCYPLFSRIRDFAASSQTRTRLPALPLAAGWVLLSLFSRLLPAPYTLLSLLAVVFLVPVQLAANRSNSQVAPSHKANRRLSAWNWMVVVPGGLLVLLALAGILLRTR